MPQNNLGELTLLELVELLHRAADEIQLRAMQTAGETEDV